MSGIANQFQNELPRPSGGVAESYPTGNPRVVTGHSYAELNELFGNLRPPSTAPEGRLRGHVTTLMGTSWMPRFVRRFLAVFLGAILPWSAKEFLGAFGSNIWFGVPHGARWLHYAISEQAGTDGKPVIWLTYDIDRNWSLLRSIRGEARSLAPGVLLCRMQWKTRKGYFTVMYFTLSVQ